VSLGVYLPPCYCTFTTCFWIATYYNTLNCPKNMDASPQRMNVEDGRRPPAAKRPRTDPDGQHEIDRYSMEALLSVPVEIVFRKCSSQEGRPLLTRAEAEAFLKISFMAQEIDTLIGLAEEILMQQRYCCQYKKELLESNLHPMLRPVIPIISLLETQPKSALKDLQSSLCQLVAELRGCAAVLRQSAEQNWTLSEALDGLAANDESGQSLSEEKRKVTDLEEEIVLRIEKLTAMSNYEQGENMACAQDGNHCRKLFAGEESSKNNETEQDYSLGTQPISEICSELFQMTFSEPGVENDGDKEAGGASDASKDNQTPEVRPSEVATENDDEGNEKDESTEVFEKLVEQKDNSISMKLGQTEELYTKMVTLEKDVAEKETLLNYDKETLELLEHSLAETEKDLPSEKKKVVDVGKEKPVQNQEIAAPLTDDMDDVMDHQEEEKDNNIMKFLPFRTQPDLSWTYDGLSSDDIVDDDNDDNDDRNHHQVDGTACSQRTSNAAETLAVLANIGIQSNDDSI
jgi:hypothetical protein